MPEKRYYAVTTTNEATGLQRTAYVCAHSPADFLKHATMSAGEKAKPGKLYAMPNGETLIYSKATKGDYDAYTAAQKHNAEIIAAEEIETPSSEFTDGLTYSADEMDSEPDAILRSYDDEGHMIGDPDAMDAHAEAEQVVKHAFEAERRLDVDREIRLRLSVNDDSHLTGETIFDDDVIVSLGFDYFLNGSQYDAFVKVANDAGYSVTTPADSMLRFMSASNPPRKGVVYFCPWNGVLPYEAEDTENDRAFYFATKAEAESHLREVWGIQHIVFGGERKAELGDIIEDKTGAVMVPERTNAPITITDAGGYLQGKTATDRTRMMSYGVCGWLNYDEYPNAARKLTTAGVTVLCDDTVKLDQALKLFAPEDLPEGAEGIIEGPRSYAAFKVLVPQLSKRQQRRQPGALFGLRRAKV